MDLHALRVFKAVVDHRGFQKAAEATFLTQPAVSQAVARLERELKVPLLVRSRPPVPTPAGKRVHALATDLVGREAAARRDLDELRRGGQGVLTLGASQALSAEVLPGLVAAFHASRPRAALRFETHPSRELVTLVADGRLELGLGPFQRHMPGFVRHRLGQQRLVLYVGRGSALARSLRKDGASALRDVPLVTSQLDAPGARPGGGRLRDRFATVWEVHSLDLRLEIVRSGVAAGYLPESSVVRARLTRALVPADVPDLPAFDRDVGLFHLASRPPSELARELLAVALSEGRRLRHKPRGSRPSARG